MQEHSSAQVAVIRADLEQVQALLGDAIGGLVESVTEISRLSRGDPARCNATVRRIDACVAEALTRLQFQDMVHQLLECSKRRLDGLSGEVATQAAPVMSRTLAEGELELF